jgi:hypothetical protein
LKKTGRGKPYDAEDMQSTMKATKRCQKPAIALSSPYLIIAHDFTSIISMFGVEILRWIL